MGITINKNTFVQLLTSFLKTSFSREIMREIQKLRIQQEIHAERTASVQYNPTLMAELLLLRQRKDELEMRMTALQDSRKDLVTQLDALMKLLKVKTVYVNSDACLRTKIDVNYWTE